MLYISVFDSLMPLLHGFETSTLSLKKCIQSNFGISNLKGKIKKFEILKIRIIENRLLSIVE